jgi:hypothetical protein
MVAVTAALIGFFAFVIMRVTTPQMTTLFTDLSVEDSTGIVKDLERQAIPFELRNDGAVIMVPKDKVTRLRMKLAEGGLPMGGRRRLRNLRQVRRARHHQLRPEHQSPACARGRTGPYHPRHRPHPGRAGAPGIARAAAVFARDARAIGLDRGAGARLARTAADQGHPSRGRFRRQRPEAAAGIDRR